MQTLWAGLLLVFKLGMFGNGKGYERELKCKGGREGKVGLAVCKCKKRTSYVMFYLERERERNEIPEKASTLHNMHTPSTRFPCQQQRALFRLLIQYTSVRLAVWWHRSLSLLADTHDNLTLALG